MKFNKGLNPNFRTYTDQDRYDAYKRRNEVFEQAKRANVNLTIDFNVKGSNNKQKIDALEAQILLMQSEMAKKNNKPELPKEYYIRYTGTYASRTWKAEDHYIPEVKQGDEYKQLYRDVPEASAKEFIRMAKQSEQVKKNPKRIKL